jgi:hypothetical protein
LKESFNFLISGTTVYFYFKNQLSIPFALGNFFKFHWGSVVAGSFLLDFFYILDVFYDFMKPRNEENLSVFAKICCCCDRILGLARSDTFSFLNLVGQPYCNSARYCEEIGDRSDQFEGSQSVFRVIVCVNLVFQDWISRDAGIAVNDFDVWVYVRIVE